MPWPWSCAVPARPPGAWPRACGALPRAPGAASGWPSPLIAEPVDPEVDEQRLRYREAYAALFVELLEEGRRSGAFQLSLVPLAAACLVGAIAEALVGPLSPRRAPLATAASRNRVWSR